LVLLINVYTLSSKKLQIRAKQFLPGSKGVGGRGKGRGERERGEMTQTLYAHMNKRNFKKIFKGSHLNYNVLINIKFVI
jgi:hypothetical protein